MSEHVKDDYISNLSKLAISFSGRWDGEWISLEMTSNSPVGISYMQYELKGIIESVNLNDENFSQENLWLNFVSFILLKYLHKTNSTYLHLPPGNAHVH